MGSPREDIQIGKVSVIVPIKNMAGRLTFVQRLMENNLPEIILVEDSSTDQTYVELLAIVRDSGSRVNILSGNFGGPGSARNLGLNVAQSEYVAFFDSDDENFAGAGLSNMLQLAINSDADVVVGAFEVLDTNTNTIYRHSACSQFEDALRQIPGIWRLLFRRDFLEANQLRFTDLKMGEDLLFLLDCFLSHPKIAILDEYVYRYRVGQIGQSTRSTESLIDLRRLLSMLESRYRDCTEASSRALVSFIWLKTLGSTLRRLKGNVLVWTFLDVLRTALRSPMLVIGALYQFPNLLLKRVPLMSNASRVKD